MFDKPLEEATSAEDMDMFKREELEGGVMPAGKVLDLEIPTDP
jgi:hypothetical protein